MPTVVIDISAHGFGHAGQVAPVIAAVSAARPDIAWIVRCGLRQRQLETFIGQPFALHPPAPDIGLIMNSPIEADVAATRRAYADLHARWQQTVEREARALQALRPALLVSNASYVGLAAAQRCGIANVAFGSLNWADVLAAYHCVGPEVLAEIRSCYQRAHFFIQIEPHLPMPWIGNRRPVAPVARRGKRRRQQLIERLGCGNDHILALVTLGGIRNGADLVRLPEREGLVWLHDGPETPSMASISGLPFPFIDIMASCDVLVTKTGYGTLVEAACNGVPVLYIARPDWPESPYLEEWIQARGLGAPVPADGEAIASMLPRFLATVLKRSGGARGRRAGARPPPGRPRSGDGGS